MIVQFNVFKEQGNDDSSNSPITFNLNLPTITSGSVGLSPDKVILNYIQNEERLYISNVEFTEPMTITRRVGGQNITVDQYPKPEEGSINFSDEVKTEMEVDSEPDNHDKVKLWWKLPMDNIYTRVGEWKLFNKENGKYKEISLREASAEAIIFTEKYLYEVLSKVFFLYFQYF